MEVRISIPVGRRTTAATKSATRYPSHSAKPKTEETKRVIEGAIAEKKITAVRDTAIDLMGPLQIEKAIPCATES